VLLPLSVFVGDILAGLLATFGGAVPGAGTAVVLVPFDEAGLPLEGPPFSTTSGWDFGVVERCSKETTSNIVHKSVFMIGDLQYNSPCRNQLLERV
jgi:hypothetical protein